VPSASIVKSANDYEAACQQQQQQYGVSHEAAMARVAILHPDLAKAKADIAKGGDSATTRFVKAVSDVMQRDHVERTEAMRRVRKSMPGSQFAKYQEV
jgi:hypothetical protein